MRRQSWVYSGLIVAGLVLGLALPAQAALVDRGGGFIYDDVLDITWTQNAGLSGTNTWANQMAWAAGLSINDTVRGVTWDDWRLASMSVSSGLPTGSIAVAVSCAGSTTEMACRDNELGYMYYQNLGGNFPDDLTGNQVPFTNIANVYWSGTGFAPDASSAWTFSFENGSLLASNKNVNLHAWAVRDGDVSAPVPAPSAMLLMGSGLVGLLAWRRLRRG